MAGELHRIISWAFWTANLVGESSPGAACTAIAAEPARVAAAASRHLLLHLHSSSTPSLSSWRTPPLPT